MHITRLLDAIKGLINAFVEYWMIRASGTPYRHCSIGDVLMVHYLLSRDYAVPEFAGFNVKLPEIESADEFDE